MTKTVPRNKDRSQSRTPADAKAPHSQSTRRRRAKRSEPDRCFRRGRSRRLHRVQRSPHGSSQAGHSFPHLWSAAEAGVFCKIRGAAYEPALLLRSARFIRSTGSDGLQRACVHRIDPSRGSRDVRRVDEAHNARGACSVNVTQRRIMTPAERGGGTFPIWFRGDHVIQMRAAPAK